MASVVRALGNYIPDYLCRSFELSQDHVYSQQIDYHNQPLQTGDIIGFSQAQETDLRQTHLGVIRIHPKTQEIDVLHATKIKGKVEAAKISDLLQEPQYARIVFVKRPTFSLQALVDTKAQENLGFWSLGRTQGSLRR